MLYFIIPPKTVIESNVSIPPKEYIACSLASIPVEVVRTSSIPLGSTPSPSKGRDTVSMFVSIFGSSHSMSSKETHSPSKHKASWFQQSPSSSKE